MQSVSTQFDDYADGTVRPITWSVLMSFDKTYNSSTDFFTIGVSLIGGDDIIKGDGSVLQEWDKYAYVDYSDRLMGFEWTRQEEPISSVVLSMGDMTLNNYDKYFTPNSGSPIDAYILPYRPAKLFGGFGGENIPGLIGITESMPVIDKQTVQFHIIDFMYSLFNRPLDESVIMTDSRTDEVLDYLLQLVGLSPTQYDLDLGFNLINFVYFPKGTKFGDAIRELMEAEMGRFYMDEAGIITFKNRQNYSSTPVYTFDSDNIVDITTVKKDDIVNVVEIKANVREVQANQKMWEMQSATLIPANSTVDIWADYDDPVTTTDDPVYVTSATTSLYTTNLAEDGSLAANNAAISLDSIAKFAQSTKMTFENTSSTPTYLTTLELFARPAKVVKQIYVREVDQASVDEFDERILTIENDFIQDESTAQSKAIILLEDYSTFGSVQEMKVKGHWGLQPGDVVDVNYAPYTDTYVITKITNKLISPQYEQIITLRKKQPTNYFTIGVSLIEGTDVIAP